MTTPPRPGVPGTPGELIHGLDAQTDELVSLLRALDDPRVIRRPAEGKWAVIEHVDHLVKVNARYADALGDALNRGWTAGKTGAGPFRGSVVGRFFARSMEPPVRKRIKTMKAMEPGTALEIDATRAAFEDAQNRIRELLARAESDGLDLDGIRMGSPFLPLVRAPVSSWFAVVTAHTRRHIWLIRETLEQV